MANLPVFGEICVDFSHVVDCSEADLRLFVVFCTEYIIVERLSEFAPRISIANILMNEVGMEMETKHGFNENRGNITSKSYRNK